MTKDSDLHFIASLRLFARSLCRNETEADQLVGETLAMAGRSIKKVGKHMVLRHLLTVMRNRYYGAIGDDAALEEPKSYPICLYHKTPGESGPIKRHEVDIAISLLPIHLREALVLFLVFDYDVYQVSSVVGCDIDAAFNRVHRARHMVQGYLQKLPENADATAPTDKVTRH